MQQSNDKQRRAELGDFLRTRRARLSSTQIGMPEAPRRRTPGLRREEVAIAAGVSTTWYTYLEQGRDIQVSGSILASLANILQLTEDERIHLFVLANQPLIAKSPPLEEPFRRTYQQVLDELGTIPALLIGRTYDILSWNRAATLVFGDFERIPVNERNVLWLLFSTTFWKRKIRLFAPRDQYAKEVLETFRSRITGHQADPAVRAFIERLQQASPTFRDLWAEHNVRSTCATRKQLQHPLVGEMTLDYAKFQVIEHPDIRCHMYLAADEKTAQQLHSLLKDEPLSVESR